MLIGSITHAIIPHEENFCIQANMNWLFGSGRKLSMNIARLVVIVVTSLVFTFSVYAQTLESLTPQIIEGYINSIRDLQDIGKRYNTEEIVRSDISGDR
jgi:hypothetical protein